MNQLEHQDASTYDGYSEPPSVLNEPIPQYLQQKHQALEDAQPNQTPPLGAQPVSIKTALPSLTTVTTSQVIAIQSKSTVQPRVPTGQKAKMPQGIHFNGDAFYPCDVSIEGHFTGTLSTQGQVTVEIGEIGFVKGTVKSHNIDVRGNVHGVLDCPEGLVSFGPLAVCTGTVTYAKLKIEEGAEVDATTKKAKKESGESSQF